MAVKYAPGKSTSSAKSKVATALLGGVIVAVLVGKLIGWQSAPLMGWDMTGVIYLVWTWAVVWPMNKEDTKSHAVREDPSRAMADVVVLAASIASLLGVGLILFESSNSEGAAKFLQVLLGFVSVVISWATVHTLFTLRYAKQYYETPEGGVDFNSNERPDYKDFAYLAFTVGMTFQVSDTEVSHKEIRQTILHQALIAYMFGTVIVASTINIIAGLSK